MIELRETLGQPVKVSWMGTDYAITIGRRESAGIVGMFDSVVLPGGGPPLHVHHREDEVIHVIEGDYEFWRDGEQFHARPGQSVFLPRDVPHGFRVSGSRPGRNLTLVTPGGFEAFFIEAAERDLAIPRDMAELSDLAGRFGLDFLGPVPWRN